MEERGEEGEKEGRAEEEKERRGRKEKEKERRIQRLKKGGHTYRLEIGAVHVGRSSPCVPVLPTKTVLVGSTLHT